MKLKIIAVLAIPLLTAIAAQTAAASDRHHARMKQRPVVSEQIRNSNAYAAPGDIAVQPSWPDYSEGAMTSGMAGH